MKKIMSCMLLLTLLIAKLHAQTCFLYTNAPQNRVCLNQTITLYAAGGHSSANKWLWDYGDGNYGVSLANQQVWRYNSPGAYRPRVTIKADGQPDCVVYGDTVYVYPLPDANLVSSTGNIHCWKSNYVCFQDQSAAASPLPGQPKANLFKRIVLFGDGNLNNSAPTPANKNFCHSYTDPADRTYTVTIRVTDQNSCVDTAKIKVRVIGSMGLKATVSSCDSLGNPTSIGCAQNPPIFCTWYCFSNNSDIFYHPSLTDSVMKFRWDFGDGDIDTVNWSPRHKYCANGVFQPRLIVWDVNGCIDTLRTNTVKNSSFKFDITAQAKKQCVSAGKFTWSQTPIPAAQYTWKFYQSPNPPFNNSTQQYQYNWTPISPDPKIFAESATYTPSRNIPCGAARVNLTISIPGCADTISSWDTVETTGPDAKIEIPGSPGTAIPENMRYQCKVTNPVQFPNNSCYYKAFHVKRLWDFGDPYARRCTTDTKKGINVSGHDTLSLLDAIKYPPGSNRSCNCNFSKDSLPTHVYTDWDTLALRVVAGQTFIPAGQAPYSTKNFPAYTAKLILYDSVNLCSDTDRVVLVFGPAKSGPADALNASNSKVVLPWVQYNDPVRLKYSGSVCFGPAPYGVLFDLSGLQPAYSRSFVAINFDSAAPGSGKWITHPDLYTALNKQQPWSIPPAPKVWPNIIAHNYFDPPGIADTSGFITIGLVTGNGYGSNMCLDTTWYHRFIRLTPMDARWSLNMPHGQSGCLSTIKASIMNKLQDSIAVIAWDWDDGTVTIDSIQRPGSKPGINTYKRTRFEVNAAGQVSSQADYSQVPEGVIGFDTLTHTYSKKGRYYPTLRLTTTQGCPAFHVKEVVAGFGSDFTISDSVVCVNDTVQFRDSMYYWIYPEPLFPPKEIFLAGRDPYLGGLRKTLPQAPYQLEKLDWRILRWAPSSGQLNLVTQMTGPLPKYAFTQPGLYAVEFLATDSTGCQDTVRKWVSVTDVQAGILTSKPVFSCLDTTQLFDQSTLIDPYFIALGTRTDSINSNGHYWEFGDGGAPSVLQNPIHDYRNNGSFVVYHKIVTANGCMAEATDTVHIEGPTPHFKILGASSGAAPLKVTFQNLSNANNNFSKSFIWNFGDPADPFNSFATNSDTAVTKTFTKPGIYCITLIASDKQQPTPNLCPLRIYPDSLTPAHQKICVTVGPNGVTQPVVLQQKIVLYPNPASSLLTIVSEDDLSQAKLHVLDLLGRKYDGFIPRYNGNRQFSISVQTLTPGAYILEIRNAEQVKRVWFIKE